MITWCNKASGQNRFAEATGNTYPPGQVRDRFRIGTNHFETIPATGGLYFLPEDPQERNNLAAPYPRKAAELAALLAAEIE